MTGHDSITRNGSVSGVRHRRTSASALVSALKLRELKARTKPLPPVWLCPTLRPPGRPFICHHTHTRQAGRQAERKGFLSVSDLHVSQSVLAPSGHTCSGNCLVLPKCARILSFSAHRLSSQWGSPTTSSCTNPNRRRPQERQVIERTQGHYRPPQGPCLLTI